MEHLTLVAGRMPESLSEQLHSDLRVRESFRQGCPWFASRNTVDPLILLSDQAT